MVKLKPSTRRSTSAYCAPTGRRPAFVPAIRPSQNGGAAWPGRSAPRPDRGAGSLPVLEPPDPLLAPEAELGKPLCPLGARIAAGVPAVDDVKRVAREGSGGLLVEAAVGKADGTGDVSPR